MKPMYTVEAAWTSKAGLEAVVILGRLGHRCGYVGVTEGHPAFGKKYDEQLDCLTKDAVDNITLGTKSPMLLITASCGADSENSIRRSLDILIDVHGGLTYSSDSYPPSDYPISTTNQWWFGFDAGHYMDDPEIQDTAYMIVECEHLAKQLQELSEASNAP